MEEINDVDPFYDLYIKMVTGYFLSEKSIIVKIQSSSLSIGMSFRGYVFAL